MKGVGSFPNYYKKRIARIYPTIIVVAIIASLFFSSPKMVIDDIVLGGGWFVKCIMIYYVPLYFVRKYFMNHFKWLWVVTVLIILLSYYTIFADESHEYYLYGFTYFKWVFFFLFMLYGGYVGIHQSDYHYSKWCIVKLIACVVIWYSFFIFNKRYPLIVDLQYVSLLPLFGIVHYLYVLCNHPILMRLAKTQIFGQIIYIVGGLCLEAYLIQIYLFTDKLNWMFPMNLPRIMLLVLVVAYMVNFLSNLLSQTFKAEDYDYKKMYLHK